MPGRVNVFQFGGATAKVNLSYYNELSDPDSSSVPYDPEVETEFSRLRGRENFSDLMLQVRKGAMATLIRQKTLRSTAIVIEEDADEAIIVRIPKKRSKSLDQFHTIVLSDHRNKTNNNSKAIAADTAKEGQNTGEANIQQLDKETKNASFANLQVTL